MGLVVGQNYSRSQRIIIADDEEICRDIAARICKITVPRIEIDEVSNGRNLVEKVRQGDYALVLTDNDMPLMSGVEATRKIRTFNPYVPICLISGKFGIEKEVFEAGANHFLKKPYEVFELMNLVKKYCNGNVC